MSSIQNFNSMEQDSDHQEDEEIQDYDIPIVIVDI